MEECMEYAVAYILLQRMKRKERLRKERLRKRLVVPQIRKPLVLSTDASYINVFRLTNDMIFELEKELEPHLSKATELCNRTKILCTLSYLAHGSYQKIVGRYTRTFISHHAASLAINDVLQAMCHSDVVDKYIKYPQNAEEMLVFKEKFFQKFKIPDTIGCIDGTIITMKKTITDFEDLYYCGKGFYGINAILVIDADRNVLVADVSSGAAVADNHVVEDLGIIFDLHSLNDKGETVHLLGDSSLAQRSFMMTPIANPANSAEEHYNRLHSAAMDNVNRTIAELKARFRCLLAHRPLHFDNPDMVEKVVTACCILHNKCNTAKLPVPSLPGYLQRSDARQLKCIERFRRTSEDESEDEKMEESSEDDEDDDEDESSENESDTDMEDAPEPDYDCNPKALEKGCECRKSLISKIYETDKNVSEK